MYRWEQVPRYGPWLLSPRWLIPKVALPQRHPLGKGTATRAKVEGTGTGAKAEVTALGPKVDEGIGRWPWRRPTRGWSAGAWWGWELPWS
jgi:hypothetical protein